MSGPALTPECYGGACGACDSDACGCECHCEFCRDEPDGDVCEFCGDWTPCDCDIAIMQDLEGDDDKEAL